MTPTKAASRTATLVAVLLAVLSLLTLPAVALSATAAASPAQSVTSGTFRAVMASMTATTFPQGPLTVDIPRNSTASIYIKAVNIGSLPLVAGLYKRTNVPNTVNVIGTAAVVLESCSGTWDGATAPGACTGGVVTVLNTSGTVSSAYPPLVSTPAGKQLRIRVTTKDGTNITRMRFDVELRQAQVRAAVTTPS